MFSLQLTPGQDPQQPITEAPSLEESDRCKSAPTSPCDQGTELHTLSLNLSSLSLSLIHIHNLCAHLKR